MAATTLIYGMGSAPLLGFFPSPSISFGSGFTAGAIAIDGAGNVFVADPYKGSVFEINAASGTPMPLGSGISFPCALALDGAGNLFVSDAGQDRVVELAAAGGAQTTISTGLRGACGLALDGAGNLYINKAEEFSSEIVKLPAAGGPPQRIVSFPFDFLWGLAMDSEGNLYACNYHGGQILKIPAGSTSTEVVVDGLTSPLGVTVDAAGNIYAEDTFEITEFPAGGGSPIKRAPENFGLGGLALDPAGNLYFGDNGEVTELLSTQPPSLKFASTPEGAENSDGYQPDVILQNMGTALLNVTVSTPLDFPEPSGTSSNDGCRSAHLPPGQFCTIPIEFHPQSPLQGASLKQLSEDVAVTSNTLNLVQNAQSIPVTGTETMPLPTLTLSSSQTIVGSTDNVTISANAQGSYGAPSGSFGFYSGGTLLGSSPGIQVWNAGLAVFSFASITTSSLPPGTHAVIAVYSGDATYAGTTSNPIDITIPPPVNVPPFHF